MAQAPTPRFAADAKTQEIIMAPIGTGPARPIISPRAAELSSTQATNRSRERHRPATTRPTTAELCSDAIMIQLPPSSDNNSLSSQPIPPPAPL
jgi:hypothetical protein